MPREHVRVEADREADEAHELPEDLERDDQREHRLRHVRDPALEVGDRAVFPDPLDVREDERHQCERERDREGRRGGEDREGRDADAADLPALVRERQRDESEHVDDPDEDHERRDVREPAPDRLRRQALLGDLDLRDLVDRLAERLPAVRAAARADTHEHEAERDRADRAEHEVHDRLVDRHVDRAELQLRAPRMQVPLHRRVELRLFLTGLRERERRKGQREQRHDRECALHAFASPPKYAAMPTPSSTVNATA